MRISTAFEGIEIALKMKCTIPYTIKPNIIIITVDFNILKKFMYSKFLNFMQEFIATRRNSVIKIADPAPIYAYLFINTIFKIIANIVVRIAIIISI